MHNRKQGGEAMFTLEEKEYLLKLLKKQKRNLFKPTPKIHQSLTEKLEQMIRNEKVNHKELKTRL